MKKTLPTLLGALLICATPCPAQSWSSMDKFPAYTDFSIPKPDRPTKVTEKDLQLTDAFLPLFPKGLPTASQETLYKLYAYYKDDPLGQKEWSSMQKGAIRVISNWDIKERSGFGAARYIKSLGTLTTLSKVYVFTGNELVSLFIRGHLAKMAALPMDFWVHAELRGYNPKKPRGGLETAANCKILSFALSAVGKDMTPEERATIEKAYYEGAHKPTMVWLEKFRPNNWTAACASGLMYSAWYFHDEAARRLAMDGLRYYVDNSICPDGSYAEGYGYFEYPIGLLFSAAQVMTGEEIREVFGRSYLKDSMKWRVYGHLFDIEGKGAPGVMRISYGDNPYGNRGLKGVDSPGQFCKIVYGDGVAAWLHDKFGTRFNADCLMLAEKLGFTGIAPTSPEEAGLPLTRAFDSGDCFIRSSWEDEAIVLALKSGDGGKIVGYAHNRPELQSIALGAFGEYLIVTAGSASYRSRIHNEYDTNTLSANTITIDGMNQKRPGKPAYRKGHWDNRAVFVEGTPLAKVTRCETLPDGGSILRSDAPDSYHIDMQEASRTVRFVPEGGFFIVRDRMTPKDGEQHRFDYRLHINNRDGKAQIEGKAPMLSIRRPKADLYIAVKSARKVKLIQEDGYMHGPIGRDYDEGGPMQGAPGSAVTLDWQSDAKDLDLCAVLYPKRSGEPAPKIKFSGKQVVVDGRKYDIPE